MDNSPDIGVPIMRTPAHFPHALAMYLVCSPFAFRCHPIVASFYLSLTTNSPPNKSMTVGHNVVADRQNGYICIYMYLYFIFCALLSIQFAAWMANNTLLACRIIQLLLAHKTEWVSDMFIEIRWKFAKRWPIAVTACIVFYFLAFA